MKSVLITFDQAYYERIMALLDRLGCRGFTYRILEAMHGLVCVRLSLRWSMTVK